MNDLDIESTAPYYAPGFYRNITNIDYHRSVGVSSTKLKKLLTSTPTHIKYEFPNVSSDAQSLGSAVHALVLEPHNFDNLVVVLPTYNLRKPSDRENKEEFVRQHAGKIILTEYQFDTAQMMASTVLNNRFCGALLDGTVNESSIFWEDQSSVDESALLMRVRPDAISLPHLSVIDLKTAASASREAFNKQVLNFGYHISAYMYLRGVNQCEELLDMVGGPGHRFQTFMFVVVENVPPYLVACYELDYQWLAIGERHFLELANRYRIAQSMNFNVGYPEGVRELTPPSWAGRIYDL